MVMGLWRRRPLGDELVPAVRARAADGADRAGEGEHEPQGPRHLPPAQVAGTGRAPDVGREAVVAAGDDGSKLLDRGGVDLRLGGGELEGVPGVVLLEAVEERLEGRR